MKLSRLKPWAGHDGQSWPVVLPLLMVVLIPTLGVLWFMSRAMQNEQLAVRQKLRDVYQAQLFDLQHELEDYWQGRSSELDPASPEQAPSVTFAQGVRAGLADSVVVYDPVGRPAYPAPTAADLEASAPTDEQSRAQRLAQRLERSGQLDRAADAYGILAEQAGDRHRAAQALQAQARCLVRARRVDEAIDILSETLGRSEFRDAVDTQGRLIQPSSQLRALQLIEPRSSRSFQRVAADLARRLEDYGEDYGEPVVPAPQRRFLMKELSRLEPDQAFDTLAAEELAARYLESDPPPQPTRSLQPSGLPGYWRLASTDGGVVALFERERLIDELEAHLSRQRMQGSTVELLPPGEQPEGPFVVSLPAGVALRDWQLVLRPEDQTLFATAANQRIHAHMLTAGLTVLVIAVLALGVGRVMSRQLRLTRLKNDLLSTVSHELKTPLASMRLLVDTLLETGTDDAQRAREYLELIAQENVRLSRLVDNFLAFSKMDQNRQSFEKVSLSVEQLVSDATASVADRFNGPVNGPDCRFEVEVMSDLPRVVGDHAALVTVLINLLDNAYKYSEDEKHIKLRAFKENGSVCVAVIDRGIGLSPRATSKIFERFYQVDQSLSRPGSGCGLGLSIVRLIVEAHDGTVGVESRLGQGSTFTVRLPASSDPPQAEA